MNLHRTSIQFQYLLASVNILTPLFPSAKMFTQVIVACLVSLAASQYDFQYKAPSYENSYQPAYDAKPEPYSFGYDVKDDYGSTQSRKEEGDGYGNVKGSYGYTDGYGLYRQVEYVADEKGFRAYIKTNEPGTDNQNPADVQIQSYAAPVKYDEPSDDGKTTAYSRPAVPSYNQPRPSYKATPTTPAPVYQQEAYPAPSYQSEASKPYHQAHSSYASPKPAQYQTESAKYQQGQEPTKYQPAPAKLYSPY